MESFARIGARIGQIEAKIAAVSQSSAPPVAAPSGGGGSASFAAALARAATPPPPSGAAPLPFLPLNGTPGTPGTPPGGLPPPPHWITPAPVVPASAVNGASSGGVAVWEGLIQKYAGQSGVPPELVRAVMDQESSGDPKAVSSAGARGLMQLMPDTARGLNVRDSFDPEQNVRAGVALLKENLDRFHGDVSLALAAYDAGAGAVAKYNGVPPFAETQNYVSRILARVNAAPPRP